jgi:hypothetical protein
MAAEMCVMIPITTVVEDAANRCASRGAEDKGSPPSFSNA